MIEAGVEVDWRFLSGDCDCQNGMPFRASRLRWRRAPILLCGSPLGRVRGYPHVWVW